MAAAGGLQQPWHLAVHVAVPPVWIRHVIGPGNVNGPPPLIARAVRKVRWPAVIWRRASSGEAWWKRAKLTALRASGAPIFVAKDPQANPGVVWAVFEFEPVPPERKMRALIKGGERNLPWRWGGPREH